MYVDAGVAGEEAWGLGDDAGVGVIVGVGVGVGTVALAVRGRGISNDPASIARAADSDVSKMATVERAWPESVLGVFVVSYYSFHTLYISHTYLNCTIPFKIEREVGTFKFRNVTTSPNFCNAARTSLLSAMFRGIGSVVM